MSTNGGRGSASACSGSIGPALLAGALTAVAIHVSVTQIGVTFCGIAHSLLSYADAGENDTESSVSGRRTKIIATVGPASWDPAVLERLIEAGVDVFRLNFSHADRERHAGTTEAIREAAGRVGREVAVLGDLPGPKMRIGALRDDVAELETGMHVKLTPATSRAPTARSRSPGPASPRCARTSSSTSPTARSACGSTAATTAASTAEVEVGGTLSSHKGMNIPGATGPASTDNDLGWVEFAVEHGLDLLAISFVSTASDLEPVTERLRVARAPASR